ncbi:M23 family metallopeptidase [Paenibacillus pasadenensis]|uniref:M23 family metallopeptidase n=1 Tax=Paenibacillus TaxID=44249 RepID=UPI0009FFA0E9|nr:MULTISPECIES: M23 family metallopeptidase [Paenibacillus]QGG58291.1 peptidoglycan DD-metalloendopeptidase family protein [Paenibacillus sp. B01]
MRYKKLTIMMLSFVLVTFIFPAGVFAADYSIVFGNTPPSIVNFNSPLSNSSSAGFAAVNSKWNQPRSSGTNPHNGADLQAALNTNVYAPYDGWATGITVTGSYDIDFLVDANNNNVKDDGDYHVRFYHMNSRETDGKKSQGALIGKSGNQGDVPPHLHFGVCSTSGGLKWLRNEVNYRHLSSSNWSSGKDLDAYSVVAWNSNIASFTAYIRNDGTKESFSEVRIYYRTSAGSWTDGGVMNKSGDVYSYNFTGKVSSGTSVQWMFRMLRSGVSQAAFGPAKFYQPDNNPNASSYAYSYFTNTVT